VFHVTSGRGGDLAEIVLDYVQRHVDARSEPARRRDATVVDEPWTALERGARKLFGKVVPELVVS